MLRSRIFEIMTGKGRYPFFSLATLLSGVSMLYGGAVRLRRLLYSRGILATFELPRPVISVGNLTAGGTGKTPTVIHLAELISMLGYRPAIISRGYKGQGEKEGAVVSDGRCVLSDARMAGDEPYLIANLLPAVPVMVGRDRHSVGMEIIKRFQPDVILLDDGFQHLRLKRDLNILLLDARSPFGNARLIPRGTLREPAKTLQSADVVLLTRSNQMTPESYLRLVRLAQPRPVFPTTHTSMTRFTVPAQCALGGWDHKQDTATDLRGRRVFAFAGLGSNETFFGAVKDSGAQVVGVAGFEDHYAYTVGDLERIALAAGRAGALHLVTTDKDFVRLPSNTRLPFDLIVMGVTLNFGMRQGMWQEYIGRRVKNLIER